MPSPDMAKVATIVVKDEPNETASAWAHTFSAMVHKDRRSWLVYLSPFEGGENEWARIVTHAREWQVEEAFLAKLAEARNGGATWALVKLEG